MPDLLDIPPLTNEALTEIADSLFVEHDKLEAADAEAKSRRLCWMPSLTAGTFCITQ